MRVIAGKAKGSKLYSLDGLDVRPTLDRVKESLFSILYPYLMDASVLDLFAGSGSLGIEALSRGAKSCTFVDVSRMSCECVERNLNKTGLSDLAVVRKISAENFLKVSSEIYDIIFLDPPYSKGMEDVVIKNISSCIHEDTIIVLETEVIPKKYSGFEILRQAKYGRVYITLLKKETRYENSNISG